jgi:alkylation response protein AidB-like acyl-CoA dehydrogenase
MNFDFSDDQKHLKAETRRVLSEICAPSIVRAAMEGDGAGHDPRLWSQISELGWLGAAIPETYGGLGLGRLEACVIAEELGRASAPIPVSSSIYFAAEALLLSGDEAQKSRILPLLASGAAIGCVATSERAGPVRAGALEATFDGARLTGVKLPVTDGLAATHAIVLAREGQSATLVLVDLAAEGVERRPLETVDPSRGHAEIVFRGAPGERLGPAGEGQALLDQTLNRAACYLAFEQIGGAQRCLDMAVEYAKTRKAFSRPIGSFQGIKHKLADMFVALEVARSNAYFAAWALSTDAAELPRAAAAARIAASEAFHLCAKENIQTHGGMGFTWDADCHLFYRRAKLLAVQAGAPAIWKEKLVRALEARNTA